MNKITMDIKKISPQNKKNRGKKPQNTQNRIITPIFKQTESTKSNQQNQTDIYMPFRFFEQKIALESKLDAV